VCGYTVTAIGVAKPPRRIPGVRSNLNSKLEETIGNPREGEIFVSSIGVEALQ
jgi:hypothetical protein